MWQQNSTRYVTSIIVGGMRYDSKHRLQEDWWLLELAARNLSAIWRRQWFPVCYLSLACCRDVEKRPHVQDNYEITAFEAYLDLYVITGNETYLDAIRGGPCYPYS